MKILHTVEFYHPSVGGAQEVVKQISDHLVLLGHSVTVATTKLANREQKTINGVKIKEFNVSGNEVRGYRGKDIKKYQNFLMKSKFDIIMNYAAQQWTTDLMFQVIDKINSKKVLVPCGFSGLHNPAYKDYFKKLPEILKKYDKTVYLSDNYRDINFARKNRVQNMQLIPNGADEREFKKPNTKKTLSFRKKYKIKPNNLLILNVSNHTGIKGHKETIKSFQKANIDNATLMFIGDINKHAGCYNSCKKSEWIQNNIFSIINRKNKKIIVTNLDRKETIDAFFASDIFLFLSNLECSPLVLFESAAAGKPFISSNCGNAKEIAKWTKSGLIVESKQNVAGYTKVDILDAIKKIEKLVANKKLSKKLGNIGRKVWQKRFTWKKITKKYETLYTNLLKK